MSYFCILRIDVIVIISSVVITIVIVIVVFCVVEELVRMQIILPIRVLV